MQTGQHFFSCQVHAKGAVGVIQTQAHIVCSAHAARSVGVIGVHDHGVKAAKARAGVLDAIFGSARAVHAVVAMCALVEGLAHCAKAVVLQSVIEGAVVRRPHAAHGHRTEVAR